MNKRLTVLIAAALFSAGAIHAQIVINDNLSIGGFMDMSIVNTDDDDSGSDTSYNLDQTEVNFFLSFDELTGQIDVNYLGDNDSGEFDLEAAFLTYDLGGGSNVEAGKFLSYLGWETFEPTGLYQYSFAYDLVGTIPGHHNGVRYNYGDDFMAFGISLLDSLYSPDGSIGNSEYGLEAKIALFPMEGLTLFLGYGKDSMDVGSDMDVINFWASYEVGGATYALEYNTYDFGGTEGDQWLVMGNWGLTDSVAITARISEDSIDNGDSAMKYTISPGWSVNDNLGMLVEISQTDFDFAGEATSIAFETIFTW